MDEPTCVSNLLPLEKHQAEYLLRTTLSHEEWDALNRPKRTLTLYGLAEKTGEGLSSVNAEALATYQNSPRNMLITRSVIPVCASLLSDRDMSARRFLEGVGMMLEGCDFDPTAGRILDALRPTREYPGRDQLALYCAETMNFPDELVRGVEETRDIFCNVLTELKLISKIERGVTLSQCDSVEGDLITPSSKMDFAFMVDEVVYAIAQVKNGERSLLNVQQEAVALAAHLALRLLDIGIPREEILVPVVLYNGSTMSFGATIMLEPTFPSYIPMSSAFDLSSEHHRKWAIAWILKVDEHVQNMSKKARNPPPFSPREIWVDADAYFLKDITARREEIFKAVSPAGDMWGGLRHMFAALNVLDKDVEARKHVVFPLSLRMRERNVDEVLIYPQLSDYRIGTPDPFDENGEVSTKFRTFRTSLRTVVDRIHHAGVIHCDLYPSNYMWKETEDGEFDVKLIDWDCCHRLSERRFMPEMEKKIALKPTDQTTPFGVAHDLRFLELLDDVNIKNYPTLAKKLNSTDAGAVNEAFTELWKKVHPSLANLEIGGISKT